MLVALLAAGMLTGCAAPSEQEPQKQTADEGQAADQATAGTSTAARGTADEQTQEGAEEGAAAWPRTYVDGLDREVVIEARPERIVALHFGYSEYLLALDITPVGVASLAKAQTFKTLEPYSAELATAVDVGEVTAPDLERILALEPDLIIASPGVHDDSVEALSEIAPTVFKKNYTVWNETLDDYAQMLGRESEAENYTESTQAILDTVRADLAHLSDKTFLFLRPMGKSVFYIAEWPGYSYHYDSEKGFGLLAPEGLPQGGEQITLEALAALDPDYLFLQDSSENDQQALTDLESSSVWASIAAVQQGHVGELDLSVNTESPLAVRLAAEQLTGQVESWD
jgi:iron complex transport system substrate-binding protein